MLVKMGKWIATVSYTHLVLLALDFFDASINRISAWVNGMRNLQKALLYALLTPNARLKELQNESNFTELMTMQEAVSYTNLQ